MTLGQLGGGRVAAMSTHLAFGSTHAIVVEASAHPEIRDTAICFSSVWAAVDGADQRLHPAWPASCAMPSATRAAAASPQVVMAKFAGVLKRTAVPSAPLAAAIILPCRRETRVQTNLHGPFT
jgi:hypothetical protein